MAMEDPDLWVLEFGLFHELDQVAAQIKEKRNLTRAQIEASPLFRRMKLNSLSGTLANERKYPEWDKWLTVFANCCPDDWDSGPDSPHHALLNEYKAQLVLQPLLGESPDINAFLARRKTYLPFTSSATPGEAALAKEMADLAQLLKARSAKPADIRRAIDAAVADHPIDKFKRSILAFITRVKHCSPRPFLYQVYDDIATGRYVPSTKSKPFTEKELREVYGDDKGWKAIVNQTDPDVEEFAGRGQRASSSRTGGGALVRADAETEDQQKKAKATTETREGAKAKTTAPAQTAKGKRKQRDEDEDDEEKEAEEEGEGEEEEKPKAKGKEAKKSEESSKRALSSVRDLRAKSKVLREQAKKHDPLPGLLARKQTTAAPEPVFEGRDNYGDEAEAEAYDSADEGEKAKQTSASSKRQYIERHPSATRLNWDSEDESPLKTRDKQEVIRAARATVRRRKITSESESDNEREAEDDDNEGKKKRATKKVKRDPYEFKVPGERARLAGGRRKKRFWTDDEIELLLEGVRTHGLGCWAKILSEYEFAPGRTSVDLKDKYRNLLKLQAKEQEAHRAKRAALASTDAKARGRQQPPPSKKSKKGDDDEEEEEEEKERSEEEDDSTTTVGSQGRREEAEEEENAADRRNQKERSEKEKEKEKEREEDEEEAEEEREEVEDKKSKKAAAVAQSPRVGSSTTQAAAVAQSPRVGSSSRSTSTTRTAAVAQSPRVLGSTSSTSTSTQAAAAQRKQQLAAKRREDEDYDENELIIDDDEGQEAEDDEVVAKVKEREESESEREKREQEQKKTPAAAAAGQRRIAKRRQAGRAQSIAAPLLAASQEADDDRPSSSAPAVLSASARARRASVAAPRRSDELDYSD